MRSAARRFHSSVQVFGNPARAVPVWLAAATLVALFSTPVAAQVAGATGLKDLSVVANKQTAGVVLVAPDAGEWEQRAATDLVHYVEQMTGAKLNLINTEAAIKESLKANPSPAFFVGRIALTTDPGLQQVLQKTAKPNPVLRADAIVLRRRDNRVFLAGSNDESHYYAVSELLHRWGCRWYMPSEFGECIPEYPSLRIGDLEYAYAPPFEVRRYWLSWNGDQTGRPEFMRRNMMNEVHVPNGHILGQYVKELIPPGKTMFNVPIAEDRTAQHVAKQVAPLYAAGKDVQLGIEDGVYQSDSPLDKQLIALQYDKYFLTQSYTDAFMTFYNKVADALMKQYPASTSKIGFLAYANLTLPPVQDITAKKPLVAYLAPIDIDPIHGMDDPKSAPRREYKAMLYRWAKVMEGRLVIYDYDQGMLVWRDLPNPSITAVRQDMAHYRKAGILGVDTESRGALATIFLNLYFRGQLLWNPDARVDDLLDEFYRKFYGPAAEPMAQYWTAIHAAWDNTIVTEHEYFVAPAIYTPQLIAELKKNLEAAEALIRPLSQQANLSPRNRLYVERVKFTRLGFDVIDAYMSMVRAAASEADYAAAVAAGERGLAVRERLTAMNGLFTTYKVIGEHGYAWWPGEVRQYQELLPFVDGTKGTLVAKTPLIWAFRRDPQDRGLKEGWEKEPADLSAWSRLPEPESVESRQQNVDLWEQLRTDLYLQAQGIITPDFQSYTGHAWYQTELPLTAEQVQGPVHLRFPGLFNECWLYVNGVEVGHRQQSGVWWMNDYRFEWDVDLAGKLKPGKNLIALRLHNPHHFGGMFRRPFVYRLKPGQ